MENIKCIWTIMSACEGGDCKFLSGVPSVELE